jgi:predicted metal-dependent phosphotriesterase family hydrolase
MMADLFSREITEGMGGSLTRAGLIKCATGEGRISPKEEQIGAGAGGAASNGSPSRTSRVTSRSTMGPC